MTKPEIAQIILECVDEAYPVPTYFEDDVREAIVKALVIVERKPMSYAPAHMDNETYRDYIKSTPMSWMMKEH